MLRKKNKKTKKTFKSTCSWYNFAFPVLEFETYIKIFGVLSGAMVKHPHSRGLIFQRASLVGSGGGRRQRRGREEGEKRERRGREEGEKRERRGREEGERERRGRKEGEERERRGREEGEGCGGREGEKVVQGERKS
jgi:hypothetical protein